MGNYVDDKPNMMDISLNVQPFLSCSDSEGGRNKDMENIEMNMNGSNELVTEGNSEKEETVDGKDITGNHSGEENCELLSQDGESDKEKQMLEEQDLEREDINKSNKENIDETCKSKKNSLKSNGLKKKSKNQLKEERMKIHSETHRLMREREISIPYHIPKQRTLKEFLGRKKNRANIPLNMPSSKMLEIWKDIEESTKNAFEFFKSDSESDLEGCNHNEKYTKTEKKFQEKQNNKRKGSQNSNNIISSYVSNNYNTVDSGSNGSENLNSKVTNLKLELKNMNRDDNLVINKDDNMIFMSEDTVIEPSDLADGSGKYLTNSQKVEGSFGAANNGFIALNDLNNPIMLTFDLNQSQTGSPKSDTEELHDKYARQRTSDWVKNIPAYEKMLKQNKKEILLQKLNPKLLKITPKLSGEPDSFIDLENDKNGIEIGAKNLKKRFLENCFAPRNKPITEEELTIISEKNEHSEINNVATEKLIYSSPEALKDLDKPGAKLQRLREELKKKIEAKWEEENRKKMEEMQIEVQNKKIIDEDSEEEEVDDDEMEDSEDTDESEPEEDDLPLMESKKKKNRFIDSEAEESGCEEEESGNEGGDELEEENKGAVNDGCGVPEEYPGSLDRGAFGAYEYSDSQSSLIPPYQPGGGMLHGGSELTQNYEDISLPNNVLSPALKLSLDLSPSSKNSGSLLAWDIGSESPEESNTKSNFVPCFPENKDFDLNDAFEFCSGKFPGDGCESRDGPYDEVNSQELISTPDKESQLNSNALRSVIIKEIATQEGDDERQSEKKKRTRLKLVSDVSGDEMDRSLDDLNELQDITERRLTSEDYDNSSEKLLPARSRGTRKNLVFSDEEDDPETERTVAEESEDENESADENSSQNGEEDHLAYDVDRKVEYDSEEDEIVNPREYFDKEAELSGSEWSGDEDEQGLDEFEVEDGDDDKFDEKKVRSQLEKIHMRTLLDDDAREVRLLQELLFEDGDLFDDGPKRERNFRWKDLGTFFEDGENGANDPEESQSQEDLEEDEESRKVRHEKELFLLQMKSKKEEMDLDEDECGISLMKRGRVILESSSMTTITTRKMSRTVRAEVDEFNLKTTFSLTNKRGSFLSRNEEFLSRLAKFTSNAPDNILGPKHSKNFVFAVKSPEKERSSCEENSLPKRRKPTQKSECMRNKKAKLEKSTTTSKTSILDRLI